MSDIDVVETLRAKCLKSFGFSFRYFHKCATRHKAKWLLHHDVISDALEKVYSGEITRLLIAMPPRLGKTDMAVKKFIAHGLSLNPAAKFIHLSASDSLAMDNSEGAKDIVQSAEYRALFPWVRIKQSTDAKQKWYTEAGGGVYARSAAGQITGFGAGQVDYDTELGDELAELAAQCNAPDTFGKKFQFGGAIIIDDSIKPDDAESEVKRERVNERFNSTIRSRVNSIKTPIIVIMQRLHPEDLIGYLMKHEPGEWHLLELPALYYENNEPRSLDPTIYPVEKMLQFQKSEDVSQRIFFERQLQQNPQPREGLMFPKDELHYYDPATVDVPKLAEHRHFQIDPADEGGDDLAGPIGYLVGNKVYIHDVVYNKKGTDYNEPLCLQKILDHRIDSAEIEGNSAWILFAKNIRRMVGDSGSDCSIRVYKNTANKHTRILAQAGFVRQHFIFRSDWQTCSSDYRRFMQNLTDYREVQSGTSKNAHDDAPDAIAGMARYFRQTRPDLWLPSA